MPTQPSIASLAGVQRRLSSSLDLPKSFLFWFAVAAGWALVLAWTGRNAINADGLSYVDIASETAHGGPQNLINGYWSPLYPSLIAPFLFFLHPSPELESSLVHFVNWLIFMAAALCFTFFLKNWRALDIGEYPPGTDLSAFALFFWFTSQFIALSEITPDMCVAAIVFLVAGICCRLSQPTITGGTFPFLGATLALGYYAKAAMFPGALLLLAILFFLPPGKACRRRGVIIAAIVFFAASLPLVLLVSRHVGHLSISDSGSLNYLWWVNKVQRYAGWTGDATFGAPVHPPAILIEKPLTLDFRGPVKGTYPLWFDPSYWYAGARPRFNVSQQVGTLAETVRVYAAAAYDMSPLFAGAFMLLLIVRRKRIWPAVDRKLWWSIAWPLAVLVMYASVHVEYRFLGAFFLLAWLAAYRSVAQHVSSQLGIAVIGTVCLSLLLPAVARSWRPDSSVDNTRVADGLHKLGIRPGDRIAAVGPSFDAYYARLAGIRIVAQVLDANDYWRTPPSDLPRVWKSLSDIGIRAIVTNAQPSKPVTGWLTVPGTPFAILFLDHL